MQIDEGERDREQALERFQAARFVAPTPSAKLLFAHLLSNSMSSVWDPRSMLFLPMHFWNHILMMFSLTFMQHRGVHWNAGKVLCFNWVLG